MPRVHVCVSMDAHICLLVCLMTGVNEGCTVNEEAFDDAHHIVSLLCIPQDTDPHYFKVVQKYLKNEIQCKSVL